MSTIGRRGFFTAIGAALATAKAVQAASPDAPAIVFSPHACVLCGFDKMLKPWGNRVHSNVMRCADQSGCQSRQIDAILGTLTPWQKRTGVVMAKGKRTS